MISSSQRIMTLSEIAVYTTSGELPLKDVFKKLKELSGDKLEIDPKGDQEKLKEYFKKIVPDYDEEKVYVSDMKKLFTWYELLKDSIDFSKDDEPSESEDGKTLAAADHEKPVPKIHEMHGPKTENAKTSTARTRKKV
jgi:hypothetical protein